MALQVLNAGGNGTYADVIAGIDRAIAAKAAGVKLRVINASLGGYDASTALQEAVNRAAAAGIVFVAAAGNDGANLDTRPAYPCLYAAICVAATDSNDARAPFSNYSTTHVDIAAPGVNTLSTFPGSEYASYDGTSMAAPHVAGAVALLAQSGTCRSRTAAELIALVLNSANKVGGLDIAGDRR